MIKNYIRTAWRNLLKNRASSFINISGLAVGMAVAMLTGLWLHDELSFNKYHQNYDRIARVAMSGVWKDGPFVSATVSYPLAYELKTNYSDRLKHVVRAFSGPECILSSGDKKVSRTGQYMDEGAPYMFTLKMIRGSRAGLQELHSILLSASTAKALFGDADPVNRVIMINNKTSVKVTGVYEDLPLNTELNHVKFIAPFALWVGENDWIEHSAKNEWWNHFLKLYVEIKPGTTFEGIDRQIANVERDHIKGLNDQNHRDLLATNQKVMLEPMPDWHLKGMVRGKPDGSVKRMVWLVSLIGAFVLILACINFMNLSTARSEKRAHEVGVRKAIGSMRRQLVFQFFCESLVIVVFSFLLALALAVALLGWFNQLAAKEMTIPWGSPFFWMVSVAFIFITGIIAGSYPALFLSSFNPVRALKGTFRLGRESAIPRKVLVVFQFTVSVALINCTIIVLRQVQHARDRPVGYTREGLVMMKMKSDDYYGKYDLIRNELLGTGVVAEFAESMGPVTEMWSNNGGFTWPGITPSQMDQNFGTLAVSPDYGRTIGWQFIQGRDFSRQMAGDSLGMIINESAMRFMGLKEPVGTDVTWTWWQERTQVLHYKILGVVKDMIMESPYGNTRPVVFYQKGHNGGLNWMLVKVKPGVVMHDALSKIEAVMKRLIPSAPFDYQFADEEYAAKFASEERVSKLAGFFAALAIFISGLGLFGLASFTAEQRTKEVGIRKVLGATVLNIWGLLSKEFFLLVGISLMIAIPIAYYCMHSWLQDYIYRISISGWVFAASGLAALVITLATVSFQAVRTAMANPVKSLRAE